MGTEILNPELARAANGQGGPDGLIAAAAAMNTSRPLYVHAIPHAYEHLADGVTHVGVVKLSAGEELMAAERAGNNSIKLAYELAKESLRLVRTASGNARVTTFDGTADRFWNGTDPVIRNLIVSAYGKHHTPDKEATDAFLESCEIVV